MPWTGYNQHVMLHGVRQNDMRCNGGGGLSMSTSNRLGYDEQAQAFADLISSLDEYIAISTKAQQQLAQTQSEAKALLDRVQEEANEKQIKLREQVETQGAQAQEKIRSQHAKKIEAAKKDREREESLARTEHHSKVARAKRARNESAWLAETVLESGQLNEQRSHKLLVAELEKRQKNLAMIESGLVMTIGPSMAKRVADIPIDPPADPESPNSETLDALIGDASDAVDAYERGGLMKLFRGREKKIGLAQAARFAIEEARFYAEALGLQLNFDHERSLERLRDKHDSEIAKADHTQRVVINDFDRKTGAAVKAAAESYRARVGEIEAKQDRDNDELDAWRAGQLKAIDERYNTSVSEAQLKHDELTKQAQAEYIAVSTKAEAALIERGQPAAALLAELGAVARQTNLPWEEMPQSPQPQAVSMVLRMVGAGLDLRARLDQLEAPLREKLGMDPTIEIPAVLAMPGPKSLLIQHDVDGRDQALSTIRMAMTRVLASFPARKARFVMADPIGIGQSFAGFMRLADLDPSPVGQRIWADPQHIERQLHDLTEHMQTVIQKYLRADYATIEDYNRAAGEIAEPYRFVVIADMHESLTDAGAARLKSILESGPRCGVYAFMCMEQGGKLPGDLDSTLKANAVELRVEHDQAHFNDQRFDGVEITLDREPDDRLVAQIFDRVAAANDEAGRVEVPFDRLTPSEDDLWSRHCDEELVVPLGRSGAQKNQELRLGIGPRQHALIAGRTGSGKSTLLHVMITAAGMWYSPDELQMYLIDFKKGVEFKAYTGGRMPHVRAVAIESDREFGLSVLQRLDEELTTRGELFRKLGAQNLQSARTMAPEEQLPRLLLLIDEFQEFFTEDDEVSSEATLLLDRLVRQGRAFGVHVVLGSQTLAGAYSLARSTLGQIGVRIALQCSETDSYLILGEDNNAARLLERPGEAIYNNAGGLVEGNSPFQTAWLSDAQRDEAIDQFPADTRDRPPAVVFEGNKPAVFEKSLEAFTKSYPDRSIPRLLLGDSVAIAPPSAPALSRRSGANLLVVSPQPEPTTGMLISSAITFSMTPSARVVFIDPTPEDDTQFGVARKLFQNKGIEIEVVDAASADRVVSEINAIVQERASGGGDPVLLVLNGIHRLRSLRKSDDYSFSLDEESASPDKELSNILLEGPERGIWVAGWCDTLSNLERAMDRSVIREFGLRVLMQMSASDSTMLMDSSSASSLGANRAILADDVAGTGVKLRPIEHSA